MYDRRSKQIFDKKLFFQESYSDKKSIWIEIKKNWSMKLWTFNFYFKTMVT
jgi:hypothetical protein